MENIKPIFKEWAVNKSIALSAKIERIHIDNKDDLKKYIRILLYSETILPFYQRNCTLITNSINRIGDYNKGKKPSKEDIDFIKKALCENGYSYGLCEYLRSVAFEDNIWEYPISREEMNSIRHIIFKDCLDNNNDTKTVIDAFYGTADVVWNNGEKKYSYLQKNRELMLNNEISPTKKPDVDNILKIVLDALNGVAYDDDKQVTSSFPRKRYAYGDHKTECIVVTIREDSADDY